MDTYYLLTHSINILWFGIAFVSFGPLSARTTRALTPRSKRSQPAAEESSPKRMSTTQATMRFLAGFNLGFLVLAATQLVRWQSDGAFGFGWDVFFACAVAHATQFAYNVPFAVQGGYKGGAPWNVLKGPMRYVFFMDLFCLIINGLAMILTLS